MEEIRVDQIRKKHAVNDVGDSESQADRPLPGNRKPERPGHPARPKRSEQRKRAVRRPASILAAEPSPRREEDAADEEKTQERGGTPEALGQISEPRAVREPSEDDADDDQEQDHRSDRPKRRSHEDRGGRRDQQDFGRDDRRHEPPSAVDEGRQQERRHGDRHSGRHLGSPDATPLGTAGIEVIERVPLDFRGEQQRSGHDRLNQGDARRRDCGNLQDRNRFAVHRADRPANNAGEQRNQDDNREQEGTLLSPFLPEDRFQHGSSSNRGTNGVRDHRIEGTATFSFGRHGISITPVPGAILR